MQKRSALFFLIFYFISTFNGSHGKFNLGSKYGIENGYGSVRNPYEETFLEPPISEQQKQVEPENYYDIGLEKNIDERPVFGGEDYNEYLPQQQEETQYLPPSKSEYLKEILKQLENEKEYVDIMIKANKPFDNNREVHEELIPKIQHDESRLERDTEQQEIVPAPDIHINDSENDRKPEKPVKKGQSEFVEYIEPAIAKGQRNVQKFDFLGPTSDKSSYSITGAFSNGNIFMGIIMSLLIVGVILGTLTGGYYYRNVYRNQDPDFSDFTHYSPAGPGRDKKSKKYGNGTSLETGDDTLAYKAQLQHFQQAKQKIIYGDDVAGEVIPGVDFEENASDEEMDGDNNYSVYECPGLAPTGDIEITNPNFNVNPRQ
uniref:Uncharacterized protein n=1 Tax=Parastrongyloides trichosuri TaxID=131310 RepID=A0A0N4Z5U8_PARTI